MTASSIIAGSYLGLVVITRHAPAHILVGGEAAAA
jgi:hypothetical protein